MSPAEADVLRVHLAGCPACAADLELEREVCAVLRESVIADPLTRQSGYPRVLQAPEGFARGVMDALEHEGRRPGRLAGWVAGWRPAMAAVAASLLITVTALGYGAQQWLNRAFLVAQEPTGEITEVVPGPGSEGTTPGAPVPQAVDPDVPVPGAGEPGGAAGGDGGSNPVTGTGGAAKPEGTRPAPEPGKTQIATVPDLEPKVFLNKPRSISSTLLKVKVDDPRQAREKAVGMAGNLGVGYQAQTVQNHSTPVEVLRFDLESGQVDGFAAGLGGLGRVLDQQRNQWDITEQFARTLEQYQALLAQRQQAAGPEERAALDVRIRSLEQQLSEWDQDAERHILVLMLQQN
jgi:hypothetical protein